MLYTGAGAFCLSADYENLIAVNLVNNQRAIQFVVAGCQCNSGAADFIEKPYKDDALIAAIQSALKRNTPDRADEVVAAVALVETLSPRERQVLNARASGHPNKVIAFDLGISLRTVEVHRARMMDRLGVSRFAETVRFAVLAELAGY